MAQGSNYLTTYYAKRIIGDAAAANSGNGLLQSGAIASDMWIFSQNNRASAYGIKYVYDSTEGEDKVEFYGGKSAATAWVQLDTGDAVFNKVTADLEGIADYARLLYPQSSDTVCDESSWPVIPAGGVKVWGESFSNSTLKYINDGVESTITDSGHIIMWLQPDNGTSNFAMLCMRIDGTFQSSKFIGPLNGNADTATALATGRTLKVILSSNNASAAFDGSANVHDIGVDGVLGISNGGTNNSSFVEDRIIFATTRTENNNEITYLNSSGIMTDGYGIQTGSEDKTITVQRYLTVAGASGRISLVSNPTSGFSYGRGLWANNTKDGGGGYFVTLDEEAHATFYGSLSGNATSADYLSTYVATDSNTTKTILQALKNKFADIPKSVGTAIRVQIGSHAMALGYFLSGNSYNTVNTAYGGWFVAAYDIPHYVGISNGTWTDSILLHSNNYTDYTVTKTGGGASGDWNINAATATKLSNTPNNTTTFLRGDNTWSNTLVGAFTCNSTLTVNAENSTTEGGQICLKADPNHSAYHAYLDVCNNYFRVHSNGEERISVELASNGVTNIRGKLIVNQPATHRDNGVYGSYDYTKAATIWSMGTAYKIAADGSSLGSLYGAAYGYKEQAYLGNNTYAGGHQFLWCENGAVKVALGQNIWTNGSLYINGANHGIYYEGSKATYRMIRFLDNTSDIYGNGISIGGGGLTILGSGESADTIVTNVASAGGTETTYIAADGSIEFYPNQNSYDASARIWMTAGVLNIGTDGNTTRENSINIYSGAGRVQLYSAAATNGNRGLWFGAHGSGGAKSVITVNTDNSVTVSSNAITTDYITAYNSAGFISSIAGSPWPYIRFDTRAGGSTYVTTAQTNWCELYAQVPAKRDTTYYKTRFFFRQYSKTANTTTRLNYYEDYYLPETNDGRTGNGGYNILTTKDMSFSITGSSDSCTGNAATATKFGESSGYYLRYINTTDMTTWTADTLGATTSIAFTRGNVTGAYTTGHIVWLNANDVGTPFQLVVHDSSDLYLYKRWKSSGTWQAWTKMRAGYADSSGSCTGNSATTSKLLDSDHSWTATEVYNYMTARVLKAGDTMTGALKISANAYPSVRCTRTDAGETSIYLENNTSGWAMGIHCWSVGAGNFAIGQYSGTGSSKWKFKIDTNGDCWSCRDFYSARYIVSEGEGEHYLKARNTTTGVSVFLDSDGTNHGVYSGQWWNGSATKSGGGWIIYRGTDSYVHTSFRLYGAVWNDYAEYRECDSLPPGACVQEHDNGHLTAANARLIPGASIISDTFGFAEGQTEKADTPIAVSGRVLAYTYLPRHMYHAGQAVCSAPGGTIDIMTREEIRDYPDAIVGIVSEIPEYEEWGTDNIKVDGRIWIKVK